MCLCVRTLCLLLKRHALLGCGLWVAVLALPGVGLGQEASDVDPSPKKIHAFAKAQVEVNKIYSTSDGVSGGSLIKIDPDALPKPVLEAMVQAIEAHGLTLDEYNALMDAYRSDDHFRTQVVGATLDLM